ncbi:MAG: hypothetical protein MUQ30_04935 [Anaerolineae bacterium]|nr:hypothetical protein [Anaerolineae bacterium]
MSMVTRVDNAVAVFNELIGRLGQHAVASGGEEYMQPYVYLSLHTVQMLTEGWQVDFDELAAVSGASALFGYKPDDSMPRYAHLMVDAAGAMQEGLDLEPDQLIHGIDQRIATATGFGYAWTSFEGAEGAWKLIVETVDAGHTAKGWDWEGILFAGYNNAADTRDRWIFAMADGPETYTKWLSWEEFCEWVDRVIGWQQAQLGRFAGRVEPAPAKDVALQVLRDLITWSTQPPNAVHARFPGATWGLAGIRKYGEESRKADIHETWVACHDINPQWTIRNSTAVYLDRTVKAEIFTGRVNTHLEAAAEQYHAAYSCWAAFYDLLGHSVPDAVQKMPARRHAGSAIVTAWLAHEEAGLAEVKAALAAV